MGEDEPVGTDALVKPVDSWWTVLVIDPVAVPLTRAVRNVRSVTPMRLTALAHVLGLAAACCYGTGALAVGAAVFELRFVIDCMDGKLARLRRTSSAAGAYADYVGDYLVVGCATAGLSLWLSSHASTALVIALPVSFLSHIAAGQAANRETQVTGMRLPTTAAAVSSGYREMMARHRLRPLPSRIEVEHGLLFVAPLVTGAGAGDAWLVGAAMAATLYFVYETVHLTRSGWKVAREADRPTSQPVTHTPASAGRQR